MNFPIAGTIPYSVDKFQDMSVSETAMWIQNLGELLNWNNIHKHAIASKFMQHEIDGSKIMEFKTSSDLKKLEIKKLGHRMAIVKAAKQICQALELVERLKKDRVDMMEKYFQNCHEDSDFISSGLEFSNTGSKSATESLVGRHKLRRSLKCEVDWPNSDSICSRDEMICDNIMRQWEEHISKSSILRGDDRHSSISMDCESFKSFVSEFKLDRDCAKVKRNVFTCETLGNLSPQAVVPVIA